ncbi:MAG: penicillin acylase family protein [Chitinophagaceae bacterium]|nr:MAG: penicillin acylase family protein [Chitinophagaceae bacterium]
MRIVPFLISAVVTGGLIYGLNKKWGKIPPLGKFLSPQHGLWQNAEPADESFDGELKFSKLKGKVEVIMDERLVPHVFAENDEDAYFVQGYLHAKFRLWQMEFQTHAAAGRLSEILGPGPDSAILNNDRNMRRLGMVYAAEKAVIETEKNPASKAACDAYTSGVNTYIENLKESELPIEYKLLDYKPEKWNNLKIALFLKYMSLDLAGPENDMEYTNAKSFFDKDDFEKLYPVTQDSLDPIVPKGTVFPPASVKLTPPADVDSLYFQWKTTASVTGTKPDKDNGSNNWAVNGSKTQSGRPILCNDPHLGLNMPSLWYEMQLHTPGFNAYGVSFPGAPSIVIGFNDSCAWGFTNAMRDVRDYYEIHFKDDSKQEYWFDGEWKKAEVKIETFKVNGGKDFYDTVAYTIFGPVMYDKSYSGGRITNDKYYAVRWKAHDPSNEMMIFYQLNRAKNLDDYKAALPYLTCPGQNCLFADKSGNIAIWQQAVFPAKWKRQGDFVMPGFDSSFMWQGYIPMEENPHLVNPERGFVSSANQLPTDTTYPYYLGGHHDLYRGYIINRFLRQMNGITPADMQKLQTENYNVFAEFALPILLKNTDAGKLNAEEKKYLDIVSNWNKRNDPREKAVTIFKNWFDSLEAGIWNDELSQLQIPYDWPEEYTLAEALKKDSAFRFIDNINTPEKETLQDVVTAALKKAVPELAKTDKDGKLEWGKFKDSGIRHLLRLPALSRFHLFVGGGLHVINATKDFHGPSWRMIVHLTDKTEAYGVYPGGQSGNPGSKYYDEFVDQWAAGKYYSLWFMKTGDKTDKNVKWRMKFDKS